MSPDPSFEPARDGEGYLDYRRPAPAAAYRPTFSERVFEIWADPRAKIGVVIAGAVVATLAIASWCLLFVGMPKLPRTEELWTLNRQPAVQFVDARGDLLAVRGNLYGPIVRGEELPAYLGQAFIAAEDQRFLEHNGVDMQSILRAVSANFSKGHVVQGGSTLTQQLVKNLVVGNDRTLRRKAQEAWLAIEMEGSLSKQEILDLYLNRVYLGSNAYGVQAAAQAYFGKPAADLSIAEAAFLGALPKAPSRYGDDRTGAETTARVHYVLDRMTACGFITQAEAAAAKAEPLVFVDAEPFKPVSGYVLDEAMKEVEALALELPPDAVVTLTVDGALQRRAEAALEKTLSARGLGASEGAIVVLDRSGGVRALVGGRDYKKSQFDRATQALRQPGSAFKTFVYAAALEHGLAPTTVRDDAPIKLAGWEPGNYEDNYRGPITLAQALAVSSNSVAAQVGAEVGPKAIADLAKRFGVASPLHAYPSIALGADEVTLFELTRAYSTLANGGRRTATHLVSEIRDQRGDVLYVAPPAEGMAVYAPELASVMTGMLTNVVRFGTGAQAQIPGWQIAGKTGTSQSWRDAWFVGYSARMTAGVWIGNDDDRATKKVTGGGASAALFAKVMASAHRDLKPEPLAGAELASTWLDPEILEGFEEDEEGFYGDVELTEHSLTSADEPASDALARSPITATARSPEPPPFKARAPVPPAPQPPLPAIAPAPRHDDAANEDPRPRSAVPADPDESADREPEPEPEPEPAPEPPPEPEAEAGSVAPQ